MLIKDDPKHIKGFSLVPIGGRKHATNRWNGWGFVIRAINMNAKVRFVDEGINMDNYGEAVFCIHAVIHRSQIYQEVKCLVVAQVLTK